MDTSSLNETQSNYESNSCEEETWHEAVEEVIQNVPEQTIGNVIETKSYSAEELWAMQTHALLEWVLGIEWIHKERHSEQNTLVISHMEEYGEP